MGCVSVAGTAPVADGVWGEGPNERDVRGIGRSPTNDSGHRQPRRGCSLCAPDGFCLHRRHRHPPCHPYIAYFPAPSTRLRSEGRAGGARDFPAPEGAKRPEQPPNPQRKGNHPTMTDQAQRNARRRSAHPPPARSEAFKNGGLLLFFSEEGPYFFAAADQAKRKGKATPRRTATHSKKPPLLEPDCGRSAPSNRPAGYKHPGAQSRRSATPRTREETPPSRG